MERRTGGGRGAGEQAIFPASTPPFPLKKMKREIVETIGAVAVAAAAADLILSSVPSRRWVSVPVSMFKWGIPDITSDRLTCAYFLGRKV